jgi:DNA-binding transcriptional LysR family regulator
MELRHLRYFVAVADALHFARAAAHLQIAQPSLSHQIRQLETELQTTLLLRTKRRVELTDAGRLFLEEARDILARADRAAMSARHAGGGVRSRLRVAIGYCMDQSVVINAVSRFSARQREVQVEVTTLSVPSQASALRDRRLDVGFMRPPVSDLALASEVLVREPFVAVLPRNHRLASRKRVALSSLVHEPFVLVPRETVPVFHDAVLTACRVAGFMPRVSYEADHLPMLLGIVAAENAVALVPAAARKVRQHGIVLRSLSTLPSPLETVVAWRRDDPSPLVAAFLQATREVSNSRPK